MPLDFITAKISLPFGLGSIGGQWSPSEAERQASWEMYVELITRVVDLGPSDGLLREALWSYYSLFATTRAILKEAGPGASNPTSASEISFGQLAVTVLNSALRPLLATWHPLLEDHESRRPADSSRLQWEQSWDHHDDLRAAIGEVRATLEQYARLLGEACDATSLLDAPPPYIET